VLFDLAADANGLSSAGAASAAAGFMHEAMTLLGISPSERRHSKTGASVVETITFDGDAVASMTTRLTVTGPENAAEVLGDERIARLKVLAGDGVVPSGASGVDVVKAVIGARHLAKHSKDFESADRLRTALREVGIVLTDSKEGATWSVGA
jgi:cysteinyl-tRNA synthetase